MDIELILIVLVVPLALMFLRWLFKTKLFLVLFYVPYLIFMNMLLLVSWFVAEIANIDDEAEEARKEITDNTNKILEILGL